MTLLQMSVSGAAMIAVFAFARAVGIGRLPHKAFLVMWGAAAFRLLVPFTLPNAVLPALVPRAVNDAAELTAPILPVTQIAQAVQTFRTALAPVSAARGISVPPGAAPPLTVVWLAGTAMCAVFFAVSYFRFMRKFKTATPVSVGLPRFRRRVRVRVSERVSSPLTYGVLRPVIILPSMDSLDEATLRCVVAHEAVHIRRFDAAVKIFAAAVVCVHWFNPFVWLMFFLLNRDIEIACDERALRELGENRKTDYAGVLVRMEERKARFSPSLHAGFSRYAIEERIEMIMKTKKTSAVGVLLSALIIASASATCATGAATAQSGSPAPAATSAPAVAPLPTAAPVLYYRVGSKRPDTLTGNLYCAMQEMMPSADYYAYGSGAIDLKITPVNKMKMYFSINISAKSGDGVTDLPFQQVTKDVRFGIMFAEFRPDAIAAIDGGNPITMNDASNIPGDRIIGYWVSNIVRSDPANPDVIVSARPDLTGSDGFISAVSVTGDLDGTMYVTAQYAGGSAQTQTVTLGDGFTIHIAEDGAVTVQ